MADNTKLNVGALGDTIRDLDKGAGIKTQVVVLDLGGSGVESLLTPANPLPVTGNVIVTSGPDLTNAQLRASPLSVLLDPALVSPFGDLNVAEITPSIQLGFVYGINTQTGISSVVTTGVVDTNLSRLRLQSGVGAAGAATFFSRKMAKYRPGQGIIARFTTVFSVGLVSSTQIIGMGNPTDGFFFGFNGAVFGLMHRNAGVSTWTAQTAWNGDKCNGTGVSGFTWNPALGNVCQIKYPYLGYGNVTFWVMDSNTSRWILCHTIKYVNSSALVELTSPSVPFYANVANTGNTTNLLIYVGSVGVFISGQISFVTNPKWSADFYKAAITAETAVISLRNAATVNGITNTGLLRLNSVTFSTSSAAKTAGAGFLRLRIGATLGGVPAYTPTNGATVDNGVTITAANSGASLDVAATTATGGMLIFALSTSDNGSLVLDLTDKLIFIAPGETLTFSCFCTTPLFCSVSTTWTEDL